MKDVSASRNLDFKELVGNILFGFFTLCAAPMCSARLRGALPTEFGAMLHLRCLVGQGPHMAYCCLSTEQNRNKANRKNFSKFLGFQGGFFQKAPLVAEGISDGTISSRRRP
jgi:hypothetical protein